MPCPDAPKLLALAEGRLSEPEVAELYAHLDGCDDCRGVLSRLARKPLPTGVALDATLDVGSRTPGAASRTSGVFPRGSRIGRYEIEYLLGTGGLGVVYAANDPELGRRVALKVLKADPRGGRGGQERLVREARALARISHPNVVAVYDVGTFEDRVFVAMELIVGRDLRAWMEQGKRGWHEVVDVFVAAGRGLSAAHAAGLIHRDFKPDNVLIGDDGRVCVTDFGLARAAGLEVPIDEGAPVESTEDPLSTPLTQAGQVVGTPAYMAPEQHQAGDTDARTDQWSYAASFYEALHGVRPYLDTTYGELRRAVLAGQVRPPPRPSRVPRTLDAIIARGLARRPEDRWVTMEALLAALGRDRTKVPRRLASVAAALLAVLATALVSDWVLRERDAAVARTSFAAAGRAVERALRSRSESLTQLAQLSTMLPMLREVAAARDQSSFGLGSADADARQLAGLHASLRDADWDAWASTTRRGAVAVADYKGRLLYATSSPETYGNDTFGVGAVAAAYRRGGSGGGTEVEPADAAALVASGLAPPAPRSGLVVVFAQASVLAGVPQAAFIQTLAGRALLDDLGAEPGLALGLITADGALDGDVPAGLAVAARDAGDAMASARHQGRAYLIQAHALPGLAPDAPVARLVVARPADVGLAGLFPNARLVLAVSGIAMVALLLGALWRWQKFAA